MDEILIRPIPFANTYTHLPERFFARVAPTPVRAPKLVRLNTTLAQSLGMDVAALDGEAGAQIFAGNRLPAGAEPIAMVYAGHQFGNFVPRLGDGRAILLGEVARDDGATFDIHLKGAGQTPFSRSGDGRAALGPVLREYIVSEAMAALGVPTTRTLAAVTTGEIVLRDQPLPGAILTRVAASHVRVGTFQYFASRGDVEGVRVLADYVINRHYRSLRNEPAPYRALLDAVIARQAALVAQWMLIGFIHGVMNTDNTTVSGETIDFGPCAFMDGYDPRAVFSSIDRGGRYAFSNQPAIAHWNLARLAETLLPLFDDNEEKAIALATEAIDRFAPLFRQTFTAGLCAKIGLPPDDEAAALAEELLRITAENSADFTLTFRALSSASNVDALSALFKDPTAIVPWFTKWHAAIEKSSPVSAAQESMRRVNPRYIPRNHRIEQAIQAAVMNADFKPFHRLVVVLARPFEDQPENADLADPPTAGEIVHETFCGT